MTALVATHLDAVPTLPPTSPGEPEWKPLRHHLGIGAFGVNAWAAIAPGDVVIERHDEAPEIPGAHGHEELYVVVRGQARFTVGERTIDAPRGALVFVGDPEATREAVAIAPDTVVLAVGAARGEAFSPSAWEARSLREQGVLGADAGPG
jgi:hypothetical protein